MTDSSLACRGDQPTLDDCYSCLVTVKSVNKKNKQHLQYLQLFDQLHAVNLCTLISQRFMTQISLHLLLVMKMKSQPLFSYLLKIVNTFCLLSSSWIIWLEICLYQKGLLKCWLPDFERNECLRVSCFIEHGSRTTEVFPFG